MGAVRDGGADCLARCLEYTPDKQVAVLIAAGSLGQRASYLKRVIGTGAFLEACRRADNEAQWAYGHI